MNFYNTRIKGRKINNYYIKMYSYFRFYYKTTTVFFFFDYCSSRRYSLRYELISSGY